MSSKAGVAPEGRSLEPGPGFRSGEGAGYQAFWPGPGSNACPAVPAGKRVRKLFVGAILRGTILENEFAEDREGHVLFNDGGGAGVEGCCFARRNGGDGVSGGCDNGGDEECVADHGGLPGFGVLMLGGHYEVDQEPALNGSFIWGLSFNKKIDWILIYFSLLY